MRGKLAGMVVALLALSSGGLAFGAHAAERYETLAAADALDEKCGFLPYIEHEVLRDLTTEAVKLSNMAATAMKMDNDAVGDFYKAQTAKAEAIACTPENGNTIVGPVRGDILLELAVAASTAVQLDQKAKQPAVDAWGLPAFGFTIPTTTPPSEDQLKAAQMIGNYVAQQWGANAQANFDRANQIAANRIAGDPEGKDYGWSVILYGVDYQARAETDKKALVGAPYPWQKLRGVEGEWLVQRKASFGRAGATFVYLIVTGESVYAVAHKQGANAIEGQTGLRLYVRKPDAPVTKNNLPLSWDTSWRSQAQAFELKGITWTSFGGQRYRLPPEAIAAIKALKDEDNLEIAIVQGDYDQSDLSGSSRATFGAGPVKAALKP